MGTDSNDQYATFPMVRPALPRQLRRLLPRTERWYWVLNQFGHW